MSWCYPFFQSDSFMHKQKTSKFNIKPKPVQVSLSGYLRHKDFADCCVSKSPLSIYFFHNLQGLAKWKVVSINLAGTTEWEFEHGQILGSSWQQWWREQEGRRHKCSFSLVGCDGDPQTRSALCLTAFSWVTWDFHFQMRAVENLGDKSQRWDYLEQVFPRGSLVFWIATMGPLCQPWCSSSCPRLIIGITGVLKS